MIVPQQILFWGKRFFLYGAVVAIGGFLIVVVAGSYRFASDIESQQQIQQFAFVPVQPSTMSESTNDAALLSIPAFAAPIKADDNATQKLATQIAQEFIRRNPNGPGSKEFGQKIAIPKAEDLVQEFLTEGTKNFRLQPLRPNIQDVDISIIDSDDPIVLAQYIQKFFDILQHSSTDVPESLDVAAVRAIRQTYARYIADVAILAVPRLLVSTHKQYLSTIITTDRLLKLFENYEADPVQALAAASALRVVNTELATTYTNLGLFIADHHLAVSL